MQRTAATWIATIALVCPIAASGQDAPPPPRPSYEAVRATSSPVIDGDLGDAAWQNAVEITGFTQMDPEEGKPAKEQTRVRIAYDHDAIYFGLVMEDSGRVTPLLARRDSDLNNGDYARISIDSQHDRLSGAAFVVNASNVQMDMVLYNDIYNDTSWDAVWESATKIGAKGWTAEVRIPYSQLRFPDRPVHTWGFNVSRWTARTHESSRIVHTPKKESAFVSRFADLTGIEGIKPRRAFEIMPYGVGRSDFRTRVDNPLVRSSEHGIDGGLDLKLGLTSSLTLTGTINPDFGQVEVDPAVLNLTQFETFFPEKRPFFTEGANVFDFGTGPADSRWGFNMRFPTFFYSRRVGRSPQGAVSAQYADAPGETTILGAAKVTGKIGDGWTIGVLDAVTQSESGTFGSVRILSDGKREIDQWKADVEPMTNYLVARATKEYGKDSRAGFMFTSTNRRLSGDLEESLRADAYFGGIDGYTLFRKKSWIFEWLAGGSLVEGTENAIAATQQSAARYYQRPDAGHVDLDATRTSLDGYVGRVMLGRQSGKWRPNFQVQALSPGFEINDVGFLPRVDQVTSHAVLQYLDTDVKEHWRELSTWVSKYQNWNFDGDLTSNGVAFGSYMQFKNYWWTEAWGGVRANAIDDQRTRGGPTVMGPGNVYAGLDIGSDSRKNFSFDVWTEMIDANDGGDQRWYGWSVTYRPSSAIRVSLSPRYGETTTGTQYVATRNAPDYAPTYGKSYVFASLDQTQFDMGIRTEWTASARLSFQLYLQPFLASGDYHEFKQLVRPRDDEYAPVDAPFDPDFNFRSVRGSAVVRWEFRPGSAMYLAWNENREDMAPVGDFRFRRDVSALTDASSQDVFMLKFSYWLPM
jgi:hypothetical protein